MPTLAVTGSKDVQVDPDDIAAIAAAVASAEARVLPDVDHILRHEPRPVSDIRRYKRQVTNPIAPAVETALLEGLSGLSPRSGLPGQQHVHRVPPPTVSDSLAAPRRRADGA